MDCAGRKGGAHLLTKAYIPVFRASSLSSLYCAHEIRLLAYIFMISVFAFVPIIYVGTSVVVDFHAGSWK